MRSWRVGETGELNYQLSLVSGVNEFILVAADRAGNSVKTQSALIAESKKPGEMIEADRDDDGKTGATACQRCRRGA